MSATVPILLLTNHGNGGGGGSGPTTYPFDLSGGWFWFLYAVIGLVVSAIFALVILRSSDFDEDEPEEIVFAGLFGLLLGSVWFITAPAALLITGFVWLVRRFKAVGE